MGWFSSKQQPYKGFDPKKQTPKVPPARTTWNVDLELSCGNTVTITVPVNRGGGVSTPRSQYCSHGHEAQVRRAGRPY